MTDQEYLSLALAKMHTGQWFGFDGEVSYENLIIHDNTKSKPTEDEVNAKIQELKDAETQKENDRTSAQNKLKALGLTDAEIKAL